MIKKQILRAQKHSRKDLLEREETKTSQQKLTFNITYYPNFQNTRNCYQHHIRRIRKYLLMYLLQYFVMLRALKTTQSEQRYLKPIRLGDVKKNTYLVCSLIRTITNFTAKGCVINLKIQSVPLNCSLEKVLHILKSKVCGDAIYVGKAKTKF